MLVSTGHGALDLFVFFIAKSTVKALVTSLKPTSVNPLSENYCLEVSLFQQSLCHIQAIL
jgi:hypothetical protein